VGGSDTSPGSVGVEKKTVAENRFEVLKSQIMQCRVKEVRRQEVEEERVKCFKCREEGHKK